MSLREIAMFNKRSKTTYGYIFRCKVGHKMGMRKLSFFHGSSYDNRDLILFMKCYLEGHKSVTISNMNYKGSVVNWTSYILLTFR